MPEEVFPRLSVGLAGGIGTLVAAGSREGQEDTPPQDFGAESGPVWTLSEHNNVVLVRRSTDLGRSSGVERGRSGTNLARRGVERRSRGVERGREGDTPHSYYRRWQSDSLGLWTSSCWAGGGWRGGGVLLRGWSGSTPRHSYHSIPLLSLGDEGRAEGLRYLVTP